LAEANRNPGQVDAGTNETTSANNAHKNICERINMIRCFLITHAESMVGKKYAKYCKKNEL
jgi:hypothetical protein